MTTDAVSNKRKRSLTTDDATEADLDPGSQMRLGPVLGLTSLDDIAALDSLSSSYHVRFHSVLSSSKIQKKVASVLRHISSCSAHDLEKKPVSVLHARASDANKLIAIAEIAKRELGGSSSPSSTSNTPSWFQYIALGEEVKERTREGAKFLQDTSVIEETMLQNNTGEHGGDGNGEDDRGDDFEVMKTRFERAVEGRPVVRGTPIMSLFLCRTSVEALKRRYGEQSNTKQLPL